MINQCNRRLKNYGNVAQIVFRNEEAVKKQIIVFRAIEFTRTCLSIRYQMSRSAKRTNLECQEYVMHQNVFNWRHVSTIMIFSIRHQFYTEQILSQIA